MYGSSRPQNKKTVAKQAKEYNGRHVVTQFNFKKWLVLRRTNNLHSTVIYGVKKEGH